MSLEQCEEFSKLDQTTKLILQKLREDSQMVEAKLDKAVRTNQTIHQAIFQSNHTNTLEHTSTKSTIGKQIEMQTAINEIRHDSVIERVDQGNNGILQALSFAAAENRAEHDITRAEIQRIADTKFDQTISEICGNGSTPGRGGRALVDRVANLSPVELKKLQEWSTIRFGVWLAKDFVLTCFQVSQLLIEEFFGLTSILITSPGLYPDLF